MLKAEGRKNINKNKEIEMIDFAVEEQTTIVPSIKVIGIGGAGGNTVNSLVDSGCQGIYCIAANTDAQALGQSLAQHKIQLGIKTTKGLGTGANPDVGRHAAEEDLDKIMEALGTADIVFLTAGMGGGTGSGALPVIARELKKENILTIALVTTPFIFEGRRRAQIASQALEIIRKEVDALIVLPNQRLLDVVDKEASLLNSFAMINELLNQSIKSIADIITKPGYINVDFADLKAIMKGMGLAVMGTGRANGQNRASNAAKQAITTPLLENMTIKGAQGVLLNITGGPTLKLHEINEAATVIYEQAAEQSQIIVGAVIDEALQDDIVITVIATGFEKTTKQSEPFAVNSSCEQKTEPLPAAIITEPIEHHREESPVIKHPEPLTVSPEYFNQANTQDNNEPIDVNDLDVPTFMRKLSDQKEL